MKFLHVASPVNHSFDSTILLAGMEVMSCLHWLESSVVLKSTRPYSPTVIDCGSSSSQMCQVLLPVSESGMKTREKVSHFQLRFWSETFELSQLSQIEISEYM